MIETVADVAAAYQAGRCWTGILRRNGPYMPASCWTDLSYASGIPAGNYYASTPLTAAVLNGMDGIDVGPAVADGQTRYLHQFLVLPPATTIGIGQFLLHDVVMYYPFIDGDGGLQNLVNPISIPRHGGRGCRIMAVVQGAGSFYADCLITYTNEAGVPGRQVYVTLNFSSSAGSLASSALAGVAVNYPCGPYMPLAAGDLGVRSIEAIEVLAAAGGIVALVICKPLETVGMAEATVSPCEADYLLDRLHLPPIAEGAYLGMLAIGTVAGTPQTLTATITTIWG
jgi:hypothetical protein